MQLFLVDRQDRKGYVIVFCREASLEKCKLTSMLTLEVDPL